MSLRVQYRMRGTEIYSPQVEGMVSPIVKLKLTTEEIIPFSTYNEVILNSVAYQEEHTYEDYAMLIYNNLLAQVPSILTLEVTVGEESEDDVVVIWGAV